jgi:hypothetical protein
MRKLILIEGIPGSGKTTLSKRVADYMSEKGVTKHYAEGEGHPADLAWCACIPVEELESIYEKYPKYKIHMENHMYQEDSYAIIPYTQFPIEDSEFYQLMESYEVYDNRVDFDTFTQMHHKRWKRFGEKAKIVDEVNVFECAFLQNHINELLLFHNTPVDQIEEYLMNLIQTVVELNPILIYLVQPNVYETIKRVSTARLNNQGEKVWMERVIKYIEDSNYGKLHSLNGFNGMVTYFEERKKIELKILEKLPIKSVIIENKDYDWDKVWNEIVVELDSI